MRFATFTRPDGSPVSVSADEILQWDPVPAEGPLAGALVEGTRITFKTKAHQDVRELFEEVNRRLAAV